MPNWVKQNWPGLWEQRTRLQVAERTELCKRLCLRLLATHADVPEFHGLLATTELSAVDALAMSRLSERFDAKQERLESAGRQDEASSCFRRARLAYALWLFADQPARPDLSDLLYELAYALPHPHQMEEIIREELDRLERLPGVTE